MGCERCRAPSLADWPAAPECAGHRGRGGRRTSDASAGERVPFGLTLSATSGPPFSSSPRDTVFHLHVTHNSVPNAFAVYRSEDTLGFAVAALHACASHPRVRSELTHSGKYRSK
eukprot:1190110-Prorocentrum_minimum.AAC.5